MFAKATQVGFAQRVVATLVAGAVLMWSLGLFNTALAANLTTISDVMTDSDLSVTSAHTIAFTIPTGSTLSAASTFDITFPTAPGSGFTDVNTLVSGDITATVAGAGVQDSFSVLGQVVTLSLDTIGNAGEEVVVVIADLVIINPDTAGSAEIIVTTPADTGKTRVAIVDNVLVSAIVNTSFDFTITGKATTTAINGDTTTGSSSPTALNFGELVAGVPEILAQQLNVATNAINGFVVTVEQDSDLQSATGATIDGFIDGAYTNTPVVWQAPGGTLGNVNEYGHWGLTSEDDLNTTEFSGSKYVSASTTPRQVFSHTSVADGTTTHIGSTTVGYQIEITPLQEAADDYTTTLTYIATPTF